MRSKSNQRRRGAAIVEMAVCLPILMVFVLGIIEFGQGYLAKHLLANACRMGARMSIVDGATNSAVEAKVKQFFADSLRGDPDDLVVTFEVETTKGVVGTDISLATTGDICTVSTTISYDNVALISGGFLDGLSLQNECTMEHE